VAPSLGVELKAVNAQDAAFQHPQRAIGGAGVIGISGPSIHP